MLIYNSWYDIDISDENKDGADSEVFGDDTAGQDWKYCRLVTFHFNIRLKRNKHLNTMYHVKI